MIERDRYVVWTSGCTTQHSDCTVKCCVQTLALFRECCFRSHREVDLCLYRQCSNDWPALMQSCPQSIPNRSLSAPPCSVQLISCVCPELRNYRKGNESGGFTCCSLSEHIEHQVENAYNDVIRGNKQLEKGVRLKVRYTFRSAMRFACHLIRCKGCDAPAKFL